MQTKRMWIVGAGTLAALALTAGCSTSSQDSSASASASASAPSASGATRSPSISASITGDRVRAAALAALVSDRTYTGTFDGDPYTEYYAADGTLKGKSNGETYTGTWAVDGDELCFTYPDAAGGTPETDCYSVYRDGTKIMWVDAQGNVTSPTSEKGNTTGL